MIVVVEGPDCSGKTTLLQRIAERLSGDVHFVHRGPIERSIEEEYVEPLGEYADLARDTPILMDRWHFGELIYGSILRGESKLDPLDAYKIDLKLETIGAYKIFMTETDDILADRLIADGDDLVDVDQLRKVAYVYEDLMNDSHDWTRIQSTRDPDILSIMHMAMNRYVAALLLRNSIPDAVGSPSARLAVVVPDDERMDVAIRAAYNNRIRPDEIIFVYEKDAHKLFSSDMTGRTVFVAPRNHDGHAHTRYDRYSIQSLSEVIK